jgi:hypothetical protein
MARRDRDDGSTKPLVDAIDDALSAILDLVRSLKQRARDAGDDGEKAGEKIRRAAGQARKGASNRIEKAWDVLLHGTDVEGGASPKRKRRKKK